MKPFLKPFFALSAVALLATQVMALPDQPWVVPASGDLGAFATRDASIPMDMQDPDLAKAYDNFTLSMDTTITGFEWAGAYAEPLPHPAKTTDFLIQIWAPDTQAPHAPFAHVHIGPVLEFPILLGGTAGMSGPDVTVTPLPHTGPDGGPAFEYSAAVPPALLPAGDYWISILALQDFSSPDPIVDPEWQWHLGSGPGDGFTAFDRTLDPPGTMQYGILQPDKDLAFTIVPEPGTMLTALLGLIPLGLLRRKQK